MNRAQLGCRCRVFLLISVAGCADAAAPRPTNQVEPQFVTGAAAAALGSDGRFVLSDSVTIPEGELSESQARRVVAEFVKHFAVAASMSKDRGATIDQASLHSCDRAIYAASPVASMTPQPTEDGRRTWGAHWVVPMCDHGSTPVALISVSARATDLITALDQGPSLRPPWEAAAFNWYGIRADAEPSVLTPEDAAYRAYRATGRRIAVVPTVTMAPLPFAPVILRWRVGLESQVQLKGAESHSVRSRQTLIVGHVNTIRESGPVDDIPGQPNERTWTDYDGKAIRIRFSPSASVNVERVTREGR